MCHCPILDRKAGPPSWRSKPCDRRDARSSSSSDECMVTPPTSVEPLPPNPSVTGNQKGNASAELEQEASASPILKGKGSLINKMQRTPQSMLTQTKMTGYGVVQGGNVGATSVPGNATNSRPHNTTPTPAGQQTGREVVSPAKPMDTTPVAPHAASVPTAQPAAAGGAFITADFLLKALKENTDLIVGSFNQHMGELSKKIDANAGGIAANKLSVEKNATDIARGRTDLDRLAERVKALEGGSSMVHDRTERAVLSQEYLLARRSVRLWPVSGISDAEMWEAVGEFLHEILMINTDDLCQEDVEEVTRVDDATGFAGPRDEVIVRFRDVKKRDLTVVNSVNLSGRVDKSGKPTAGLRLEIPPELRDTFRLLSRFGTRLRARHGEGTKRHVKFDDYEGSLYANIKLPGDTTWTRVSPEMARKDLHASMNEESIANQKRLAAKLIPGPRERLSRPPETAAIRVRPGPALTSGSGKRPRWSGPTRPSL